MLKRLFCLFFVAMAMPWSWAAAGGADEGAADFVQAAEREKWASASSRELYDRGEEAYQKGDYEVAARIFMVLCSRYGEDDDRNLQYIFAQGFDKSGNLRYNAADYAAAMDFYLRALRIAEKYGFDDLLGSIFGHIGNIYASLNDFESAMNFYERGLSYAEAFDNPRVKSMLTNNLVAANYYKGDMEAAKRYFAMFKDLAYKDKRYTYDIYLNRSILFNGEKRNDSAEIYAKKAVRYIEENAMSPLYIAGANSSIAQFFEEDGLLDSALVYLHENERIARNTPGADDLLLSVLKDLARVYDKKQAREKALDYKSEYLALSDSVFNQKEFNRLKNKQVFYELERDASTIHRLNTVRSKQRKGLWALSIAVAVFVALIITLYLQKRKLKAAWRELYNRSRRQLEEESQGRKTVVQGEQRNRIAEDILRIMETTEDYCASDYSIDKLASTIGSNARYVSEVVNEVFGKNFRTLLNEYRIKKALTRLVDTERYGKLTIKAIGESVGYKSQATFIAAFTKFTGLKPGIYQKLALERRDS